ncbi:MAG: FUSC family protein [Alphaproteobacteria bacterium]|nr:FUSC family protein [Alphaproteobacteria bacterium]
MALNPLDRLPFGISEREAKDAARLAVQSAAAAAAMFVLMQSFAMPEKFVGVLSAVLVVQPSVGNTLGEAWDRVLATLVGSAIGILCLIALPVGYGTAAALAISMLVINAVASLRPEWRYGSVAAVALSLGSDTDLVETATDRGIAIALGVGVGAAVSLAVWPDTATKRAHRHLRTCLRATAERLNAVVDSARNTDDAKDKDARRRYHSNIDSARRAADGIRFDNADGVRERIERTARLYNSVLILNRVAEETDEVAAGNDDFADAIETVRENGCAIAAGLADGETGHADRIERIRAALEDARTFAAGNTAERDDETRAHVFRNAMVFGLGEVCDSLEDLVDAFEDASQDETLLRATTPEAVTD